MIIRSVDASWLSVPIPPEGQHVSDFGRIASFDMALVRIEVASGLVGWGESKAAVGSAGSCAALVACITDELGPQLVGRDARRITQLWEEMYNGSRHYALSSAPFRQLGRRRLNVAAISGVDMALWDLAGKSLDKPIVDLWAGPAGRTCRCMPAVVGRTQPESEPNWTATWHKASRPSRCASG